MEAEGDSETTYSHISTSGTLSHLSPECMDIF